MRQLLALILSLSISLTSSAQLVKKSDKLRRQQATACPLTRQRAHLTVREATGHNDGPAVAALIRAGGGTPGERPEWCGFTQAAANRACGLPIPRNGMQGAARAWFPLTGPDAWRTVWHRAAGRGSVDSVAVGQKAGFDYGAGIHHVACVAVLGRPVRAGRAPRSVWTIAGNEGPGSNAGVHLTLYPIGAIDGLSWW